MTARELAFIRSAIRGLQQARADLSGPDADGKIAAVIEHLYEDHSGPLTNADIAYMAAVLLAWQDRGSPDLLA